MSVIKKFFSVLIFALMLMPTCFAEDTGQFIQADDGRKFVQVSDYYVEGFYFKFNDNATNHLKNTVTMQYSPIRINSLSADDYSIYFTYCTSAYTPENTMVFFKTFKDSSYISGITVLYKPNTPSKSDDVYMGTFKNIFQIIGLTEKEMQPIFESIKANKFDQTVVNLQKQKKFVEVLFNRYDNGINEAHISVFVTK